MADYLRNAHPNLSEEERTNYCYIARPIIPLIVSQITPFKGTKSPSASISESLQDVEVHPANSPPLVPFQVSPTETCDPLRIPDTMLGKTKNASNSKGIPELAAELCRGGRFADMAQRSTLE